MTDQIHTPFTRADAMQSGMTAWQWQLLIKSDQLVRLRRGVYVRSIPGDDRLAYLQQISAKLLTRSDHYAVGPSALAILDLPNPYFRRWRNLSVLLAGSKSRPERGIRRATCAPIDTPWGRVTDLIDTATAIAAGLPLPQALMVTDAVARRLADTTDRFVLASEPCRTEVRRRLTRNHDLPALRLANPAAESPAESFYRGHMLLDGFGEPACGVPQRGASGKQYFIDLLLEGLAIEVDGRVKYTEPQVVVDEKKREDDLRATGLEFHRPFVEDLYADPAAEMRSLHNKRAEVRRSWRWAS